MSNYFPPFALGGYEQWCYETAIKLTRRGHQVDVLTGNPRASNWVSAQQALGHDGVVVHPTLHFEVERGLPHTTLRLLFRRHAVERQDLAQMQDLIGRVRPEVSLVWGMWNIARSVPRRLEELLPGRVAYYFCDYWPTLPSAYRQQWQTPAWHAPVIAFKRLLARPVLARLGREPQIQLRYDHPICVSQAVKEHLISAGLAVEHAMVIHGGTELADAPPALDAHDPPSRHRGLRMLYVGRLTSSKGVHTAIAALSRIIHELHRQAVLTVVGRGEAAYTRELVNLARTCGVGERVIFRGGASADELPAILGAHDVLVLPSEWEEPFARVTLEAMAAGLVVVGTTTGGTGEVLVEGQTGLTFPRGNSAALASQLMRLVDDPMLWQRLARAGRERVREHFTLDHMVTALEDALRCIARDGGG